MTRMKRSVQKLRRAALLVPAALLCASAVFTSPAHADSNYPGKPIRIIVPFSPGGATDTLARLFGQKLMESWGQPVLVENRPGAGGNIGAEMGARAAPDGYTLLLTAAGFMAVNPSVYPNLSFDPAKDFTPLTLLVKAPLLLVVNPKLPVKNIREFVDYARNSPGKLSIGNGGAGTAQHLGGAYMSSEAKIDVLHVPYKGSAPATTDLLAGVTDAQFDNMVTLLPYVGDGKLRPLAVSGKQRSKALPDIPTFDETVLPGFETGTWYGLVGPAGMQPAIAQKISAELRRIMALPEVGEKIASMGLDASGMSDAAYGEFIKDEIAKYAKIVKSAGVTVR